MEMTLGTERGEREGGGARERSKLKACLKETKEPTGRKWATLRGLDTAG